MTRDRAGLRVLSADECLQLLDSHLPHVGRVGFARDGGVVILPVNYRLDGSTVVFRTALDTGFAGLADGTAVAFQVDEVDATWAEGWSVLVEGTIAQVTEELQLERLRRLPLHPWAPGDRSLYLRITPGKVEGRRIE